MKHKVPILTARQLSAEMIKNLDLVTFFGANVIHKTEYVMRSSYGKYTIYKWDWNYGLRTSSTLAKGLSKEQATGMMKLLKEPT